MEYDISSILPLLPAIGASIAIFLSLIGYKMSSMDKGLKDLYERSEKLEAQVNSEMDSFFDKVREESTNPSYEELVNVVSRVSVVKEMQSNIEWMMDGLKTEVKHDLLMVMIVVVPIPVAVIFWGGRNTNMVSSRGITHCN